MTESEWLTSSDPAAMVKFIAGDGSGPGEGPNRIPASDRKLRLWMCAISRHFGVHKHDEDIAYSVDAAERMADGLLKRGERRTSMSIMDDDTRQAARFNCESIVGYGFMSDEWRVRGGIGTAWYREWDNRIKAIKADILRDLISNPWRPVTMLPSWLTPDVKTLVEAAYQKRGRKCDGRGCQNGYRIQAWGDADNSYSERIRCEACKGTGIICDGTLDNARLLVLSDALEEAGCVGEKEDRWYRCCNCGVEFRATSKYSDCNSPGCDGEDLEELVKHTTHPILAHLRSPGPHYRGCWALDLIRGVS